LSSTWALYKQCSKRVKRLNLSGSHLNTPNLSPVLPLRRIPLPVYVCQSATTSEPKPVELPLKLIATLAPSVDVTLLEREMLMSCALLPGEEYIHCGGTIWFLSPSRQRAVFHIARIVRNRCTQALCQTTSEQMLDFLPRGLRFTYEGSIDVVQEI
jgi:hypothetical protein